MSKSKYNDYLKFLKDFEELQDPDELYSNYFQYHIIHLQGLSSNTILIKDLSEIVQKYNYEYILLNNYSDLTDFSNILVNNPDYFKNKFIHFSFFDENMENTISSLQKITLQEESIRQSNLKIIFSCSTLSFNEIINTDLFYYQTLIFDEDQESLQIFHNYKELVKESNNTSTLKSDKKSNFKI